MDASCNMGYIFLVVFVFILYLRFVLVQYLKTKITRKIYPTLHSAPCDNYYVSHGFFLSYYSVDGQWGEWGEWTNCGPSCMNRTKQRYRKCVPPQNGGKKCEDLAPADADVTTCDPNPIPCPTHHSPTSESD